MGKYGLVLKEKKSKGKNGHGKERIFFSLDTWRLGKIFIVIASFW